MASACANVFSPVSSALAASRPDRLGKGAGAPAPGLRPGPQPASAATIAVLLEGVSLGVMGRAGTPGRQRPGRLDQGGGMADAGKFDATPWGRARPWPGGLARDSRSDSAPRSSRTGDALDAVVQAHSGDSAAAARGMGLLGQSQHLMEGRRDGRVVMRVQPPSAAQHRARQRQPLLGTVRAEGRADLLEHARRDLGGRRLIAEVGRRCGAGGRARCRDRRR